MSLAQNEIASWPSLLALWDRHSHEEDPVPSPSRSPPPPLALSAFVRDPKGAPPPPGPTNQLFWYIKISPSKWVFAWWGLLILFCGYAGLIFERPDILATEALRNYTDVIRNFSKRDTITSRYRIQGEEMHFRQAEIPKKDLLSREHRTGSWQRADK